MGQLQWTLGFECMGSDALRMCGSHLVVRFVSLLGDYAEEIMYTV
jgi:hypothetical protein